MFKSIILVSLLFASTLTHATTPEEAAEKFYENARRGILQVVALSANAADFRGCFDSKQSVSLSSTELKSVIEDCFTGVRLKNLIQNNPTAFTAKPEFKAEFIPACLSVKICFQDGEEVPCGHLNLITSYLEARGVPSDLFTYEDATRLCQGLVNN